MPSFRTPVLVVGAGVTGCVLALELAHHAVPSMVVERSPHPHRQSGLTLVSGRGMELLRRLGPSLTKNLRTAAVGADRPVETVWSRGLGQPPVLVSRVPSVGELLRRHAEPYLLLPGSTLAALLREAARAHPLVDLREGWTFTSMSGPAGVVDAAVLDASTRSRHVVRAQYLAGCDGGDSTVRRCLGITLDELPSAVPHCTIHFRTDRHPTPPPSTIITAGATLTRQPARGQWVGHVPLEHDETSVIDPAELLHKRVGLGLDASQILGVSQWEGALGIARTYGEGSAFLVGQSAHRFHPPGETADVCLGDAVDLGWKLAAAIQGWGGPRLTASYEDERRPRAVLERELLTLSLDVRRRFGRMVAENASPDDLARVAASAPPSPVPAHGSPWRLPAVRTADGRRLHDCLGPQFTLVDGAGTGKALVAAARARGVPMTHLADAPVPGLILVRPDHRVAWADAAPPPSWDAVLDLVTGTYEDPANA